MTAGLYRMKVNLLISIFFHLQLNSTPVPIASPETDISVTMPDNETVVQLKFTVNNYQTENDTRLGVRSKIILNHLFSLLYPHIFYTFLFYSK